MEAEKVYLAATDFSPDARHAALSSGPPRDLMIERG